MWFYNPTGINYMYFKCFQWHKYRKTPCDSSPSFLRNYHKTITLSGYLRTLRTDVRTTHIESILLHNL